MLKTARKNNSKSKLNKPVVINFTPEQKASIKKKADEMGLSLASYIRSKALDMGGIKHFAGMLDNSSADSMIREIYKDRKNKV